MTFHHDAAMVTCKQCAQMVKDISFHLYDKHLDALKPDTQARLIAKYRPRCPIAVVTRSAQVGAACNLHHGCMPILYPYPKRADLLAEETDGDERLRWALRQLREQNLVEEGDWVVLAHGWKTGVQSLATYRVLAVGDSLDGSSSTAS